MSGEIVIEAKGLTKKYGAATAVDHISFSVGRGEIFGLLGPNGAGKTTTILMMLGLTDISEGEIRVLGFDPAREPLKLGGRAYDVLMMLIEAHGAVVSKDALMAQVDQLGV